MVEHLERYFFKSGGVIMQQKLQILNSLRRKLVYLCFHSTAKKDVVNH